LRFKDFIKEGKVKKGEKDSQLAISLIDTAKQDLNFLNAIKLTEISARRLVINYYDVLRSLIEALAALDGLKVYSHEAFTYYLQEKKEDILSRKFDRFRKIRNGLSYYGKEINITEAEDILIEMKSIISNLLNTIHK